MKKSAIAELIVCGIVIVIYIILGCYQWYLDIQSKKAIIEMGKAQTQSISGEQNIQELLGDD